MKSLVIGANGLVGSALMRQLGDSAVGTVRTSDPQGKYLQMDMTNRPETTRVIDTVSPDVVYIAGAITNVDRCEEQPQLTRLTNVDAIRDMIAWIGKSAKIVFFSSSYVFDGKKETPYETGDFPCPINEYGKQKLIIESYLQAGEFKYYIVRTIGVFGKETKNKNFAAQIVRAMTLGNEIHVPFDQIMNPVYSEDLARASVQIASHGEYGIYHVGGDKCKSKFDFACDVAQQFGLIRKSIIGTSTSNMKQLADRPENGCLKVNEKISPPSYDKGIETYWKNEKR